jgi:hypothetical protein
MRAMISSMEETWSWRQRFCIPPDSSWKTPVVRPVLRRAKVFASSIGTFSMSNAGSAVRRMLSTASAITVSVFRPRKSIFSRPELADRVHVELHGDVALLERERHEFLEGPVGDDDPGRVLAGVAHHALQDARLLEDLLRGHRIPLDLLPQLGRLGHGLLERDVELVGIIFASRSASA